MVHLAPAVVGPPDPGLVPRRGDLRRHRAAATGEGWERDPDVLDTWFSSGAVAVRDARLARRDARAARLLPDRRALDGARHPLPVGRADGDVGPASSPATSRSTDVYVHSVIQAPDGRRMSKSLGTGIDPLELIEAARAAGLRRAGLPRLRRRRRALRPARDVLHPGRALQRGEDRPGPASSPTSSATRRGSCCCACPRADAARAGAAPQTVEDRWILSRLQAREGATPRRAIERVRVPPRARSGSTTSSTASCATGTSRWSSRACTPRTTRDVSADRCCTCCARRWRSRTR